MEAGMLVATKLNYLKHSGPEGQFPEAAYQVISNGDDFAAAMH